MLEQKSQSEVNIQVKTSLYAEFYTEPDFSVQCRPTSSFI